MKLYVSNSWLKSLLQQYYDNAVEFAEEVNADIIVNEKGINIKKTKQVFVLNKPVSISSLITVLEQVNVSVINIGKIKFYPGQRLCIVENEQINLTQKETEILLYLANHQEPINKADLLQQVWGYSESIDTRTIETHIYNLRSKLADKIDLNIKFV